MVMSSGRKEAPYLSVRCVLSTKSVGRKRHISAFQCTPPPPTPFGGMNAPQLRIGRAVWFILFRNVNVNCSGRRKIRRRIAPRSALDGDYFETFIGQFVGHDGAGPAESDDDDVFPGKPSGHDLPLCPRPLGTPCQADWR